jgi:hypothetical protein
MTTFRRWLLVLSPVALIACAPRNASDGEATTSSAAALSQPTGQAAFAEDMDDENSWVTGGTTDCTLTVDRSAPVLVVTLVSGTSTATLRVRADASITLDESDDHRWKDFTIAGVGEVTVLYSSENYNEIDITPLNQPKVTCGMYYG